ncbi:MAG: hypothetical protein ACYSUX_14290, partial [Planctomycetota bacterium]
MIFIFFGWILYIWKILFRLTEVRFSERFRKVMEILAGSATVVIGLNSIYVLVPMATGWMILIQTLSLFAGLGLMSAFSARFFFANSIDERWKNACKETEFVIMNPETGKKTDLPQIVGKYSDRLVIHSRSITANEIEKFADKLAGAMGIHINLVSPLIVQGELKQGFVEIWYSTKDLPFNIPFGKTPMEARALTFGYGVAGWVKMPLKKIVHLLVFGMSGQGKTVFLRNLLLQAYINN